MSSSVRKPFESPNPQRAKKEKECRKAKNIRESDDAVDLHQSSTSASNVPSEIVVSVTGPSTAQADLSAQVTSMSIAPSSSAKLNPKPKMSEQSPNSAKGTTQSKESGDLLSVFDPDPKRKVFASKKNVEDTFTELEKLTGISIKKPPSSLVLRPNFAGGQEGRKILLATNFFRMKLRGQPVYQYDIAFARADTLAPVSNEREVGRVFKRVTKKIHQILLSAFVQSEPGKVIFNGVQYAYDNERILFTNRPLNRVQADPVLETFEFTEPNNLTNVGASSVPETKSYAVLIKRAANFTLSLPKKDKNGGFRTILQAIDIITKSQAFQRDIIYGNKIFFSANLRPRHEMSVRNSPSPYELAFGYHQSSQICQAGPMQNLDRATAVLYKGGPLLDRIVELVGHDFKRTTNPDLYYDRLKEFILLRIETDYRGFISKHTIKSFTRQPSTRVLFDDNGQSISVAEYFSKRYKKRLQYENLPCIEYGDRKYLPIELCTLLPDQRNQRKLREDLIRILSQKATSQSPGDRLRETVSSAKGIASQPVLSQFGLEIVPQPVNVQSRVLDAPRLRYSGNIPFAPSLGNWTMQQPTNKKFVSSTRLQNWLLVGVETRHIDTSIASSFLKRLVEVGNMVGVTIDPPKSKYFKIQKAGLSKLAEDVKKMNLQLIVCIIPERDDLYTAIKSIGDKKIGVPTQIILDKHYNPRSNGQKQQKIMDTAYLSNLLLKINTKIGGTNLGLSDSCKPNLLKTGTMVVGVDVNHPSPGDSSPSIAAVVGSIDEDFAKYRSNIRINASRDEIVKVNEMIEPILQTYINRKGSSPQNLIVYRDGVSEGQFAQVLAYEIIPLRDGLKERFGSRAPKLTYIIVQKRHNARFYPTDSNISNQTRNGNILPGSVIDTEICHYKWFDFYLCSQNALLGTARPGKYTVLWHEGSALADELQKATYYLCYLFARATKSIADPAPARYAHHAAARGKVYLKAMQSTSRDMNAAVNETIKVDDRMHNILYFI